MLAALAVQGAFFASDPFVPLDFWTWSVVGVRELVDTASLEEIFSQLVEQRELESVARDIARAITI
jgi:hypothetical protein